MPDSQDEQPLPGGEEGVPEGAAPAKVAPEGEICPTPTSTPTSISGRVVVVAVLSAIVVVAGALASTALAGRRHPEAPPAQVASAVVAQDAAGGDATAADSATALIEDAAAPAPPTWRVASLKDEASVEVVEAAMGKRTLSAALGHAGITQREVRRLLRAFDGVRKLDRTNAKDTLVVAKDRATGRLVAFEYATSPVDVWQAKEDPEAAGDAPDAHVAQHLLVARKLDLHVDRRRVAVGVAVGRDLRESIVQAGLDEDLLKTLDDALEGHVELSDVRPGARLRIVATEDRVEGAFARYAEIDAVEYVAANPNAPPLRVYFYDRADAPQHGRHQKAHAGYYDAKGRQPFHGGWRSPVPFARITSRFNPRRMHPVLHVVMPHNGIDFGAPTGAPVYASAAGTVKIAGDGGPCGNMVQIEHANGLVTAYCHLSRFAAGLHPGQHVEPRQLVGYVGQTGRVTGPHLHFALKRGDVFLDPLALKLDGMKVLPPQDRDEFGKARADLDAALDAISLPASSPGLDDAGEGTDDSVFSDVPDPVPTGPADGGERDH